MSAQQNPDGATGKQQAVTGIGFSAVKQHTNFLCKKPDKMHGLYGNDSQWTLTDGENEISVRGKEAIKKEIQRREKVENVRMEGVHCQSAPNGAVLVMTTGIIITEKKPAPGWYFAQVFLLQPTSSGGWYFRNETFRYITAVHPAQPAPVAPASVPGPAVPAEEQSGPAAGKQTKNGKNTTKAASNRGGNIAAQKTEKKDNAENGQQLLKERMAAAAEAKRKREEKQKAYEDLEKQTQEAIQKQNLSKQKAKKVESSWAKRVATAPAQAVKGWGSSSSVVARQQVRGTQASAAAAGKGKGKGNAAVGSAGGKSQQQSLYVKNIGEGATEDILRNAFAGFGNVTNVIINEKPNPAVSYAFVEFQTAESAAKAVKISKDKPVVLPNGATLQVEMRKPKGGGSSVSAGGAPGGRRNNAGGKRRSGNGNNGGERGSGGAGSTGRRSSGRGGSRKGRN